MVRIRRLAMAVLAWAVALGAVRAQTYPSAMPQPSRYGVPLMPAPPVPRFSVSGQRATAQANVLLPQPTPAASWRENQVLPPGEVLPPPRALAPPQPAEIGALWPELMPPPGAILPHPDGKPDLAPECPSCAPRGYLYYGRAEYLMWWGQQQTAPVLLTGNAVPLVGGGDVALIAQTRHGGRFTLGCWLDNAQDLGVEIVGFFIAGDDSIYDRPSPGTPVLARPFINGVTGAPAQSIVAAPGFPGIVDIAMLNRLWGLEGNIRCELCRWNWGHLDALGGIRYLDLGENLNLLTGTNTRVGGASYAYDAFGTRNQFFGTQAGVECEIYHRKQWYFDTWAKIGLGNNAELVEIQGNRLAGGRVSPGGLLAQPSNIGVHYRNQFGYVPEVGASVGYMVQQHLRATVGYNLLLIGNIVRPGGQIDTRINTTGAGPAVPSFSFNQGEFLIHGLVAGLEFRF